ncbi:hypothetical protein ACFOMD_10750 [Sphingoaurantiacus capsulatus]|uniref:Uncharacterized protein n=1 Tax=Sphingoaurantiacus capsulatus TaxID=1771310 RepID=A0ABV7XEG4_9SPHN
MNKTKVDPELLADVLNMHADMPAEDRGSFEARAFGIFRLLADRGYSQEGGALATAISLRLTALALLARENGGRGFTMPGDEDGMDWVHADLVRCAAEEPLVEGDDEQAVFNRRSFEQRLLSICTAQGRA